jgi:hypothetical protein
MNYEKIVYNFSNHALTARERFVLGLGYDFCIPLYKPSFCKYYLAFEKLANRLKFCQNINNLTDFRSGLSDIAREFYTKMRKIHYNHCSFFKSEDRQMLINLSKNKDIVITQLDKGKGIAILNKVDYTRKMFEILDDNTKFKLINDSTFKIIFRKEDKVNRFLRELKNNNIINEKTYDELYVTGSNLGSLYGLSKIHKPNIPLRPVLAAYDLPSYKLGKFLVPLISHLAKNDYTVENSYQFYDNITKLNAPGHMVSFDVKSLFTNVPVNETIEIILNNLFPNNDSKYANFDKVNFRKMLQLSATDPHFRFDEKIYSQKDGVAMGVPIAPHFANIFMVHLEKLIDEKCPNDIKPIFYKRYVDDTFAIFENKTKVLPFLNFINNLHPNIQFTFEEENDNKLAFLDLLIHHTNNAFYTSVFRKPTFTGLGMKYFSFCSKKFKINTIKTLLYRAYHLSSDMFNFHAEVSYLKTYFFNNGYPTSLVLNQVKNFLTNIYEPRQPIPTVMKEKIYVSLPHLGYLNTLLSRELKKLIQVYFPSVDCKFIFVNPLTIGSFFNIKSPVGPLLRSRVVYLYKCPRCPRGDSYIGSTMALLKVRAAAHLGISHRTGQPLAVLPHSSIRNHSLQAQCNYKPSFKDFKIIDSTRTETALRILESLHIKQLNPILNIDSSAHPLQLT